MATKQKASKQDSSSSSTGLLGLVRSASNLVRSNSVRDAPSEQELGKNSWRSSSQLELRSLGPKVNLAEKAKMLTPDTQVTFRRCMGDLQQQETDSLISFLQEARQALRETEINLHDEQYALSATSRKISESRLGSAGSRQRQGAQSARHRPKQSGGSPTRSGSRASGPVSARSIHLSGVTPRGGRDSVTFESESGARRRGGRGRGRDDMDTMGGAVPYDSDTEYNEKKNAIMTQASGAMNRTEQERERQVALLRERKEQKKVQMEQSAREATDLMREATGIEAMKQKDRERQEEILEERKKKLTDRSTPVVVDITSTSHS